jgi:hypothetical protein
MYSGIYSLYKDQISSGVKFNRNFQYKDTRYAGTLVLYPKPFGIQAEYNIGKGPEYDTQIDSIITKNLSGGYLTLSYLIKRNKNTFIPFIRGTIYKGGKKHELDARSYDVKEIEGGIEMQLTKNFEITLAWMHSEKTTSDKIKKNNFQIGNMLRIQAQLNF